MERCASGVIIERTLPVGKEDVKRIGSTLLFTSSVLNRSPRSSLPSLPTKRAKPPRCPIPTTVLQADPPGTIQGLLDVSDSACSIKSLSTRVIPPFTAPVFFRNSSSS